MNNYAAQIAPTPTPIGNENELLRLVDEFRQVNELLHQNAEALRERLDPVLCSPFPCDGKEGTTKQQPESSLAQALNSQIEATRNAYQNLEYLRNRVRI